MSTNHEAEKYDLIIKNEQCYMLLHQTEKESEKLAKDVHVRGK